MQKYFLIRFFPPFNARLKCNKAARQLVFSTPAIVAGCNKIVPMIYSQFNNECAKYYISST